MNAGGGGSGVEFGHGCGDCAELEIQEYGVPFSDWRGVFWRTVYLDYDAGNARGISAKDAARRTRVCAVRSAWLLELHNRSDGAPRSAAFHLVGPGLSCVSIVRTAVAWLPDAVLLYLARIPKAKTGRRND